MFHSVLRFWRTLANPTTEAASRRVALVEACTIGMVSGLAAFALKQGIGWCGGIRVRGVTGWPPWLWLPVVGAIGAGVAGWMIVMLAPQAIGSGMPYVKVALTPRGLMQSKVVMSLRTAIVKLISTIAVVGSGLALGRQGPTVYVGATLAAVMTRWFPTSPSFRRQTIAAGAAAGLAAGFNAPLAGVLFVIEELLHDMSSLTLETAILASFIGAVVSRILGGSTWNLEAVVSSTSAVTFTAIDIPFLLLLGMLTGIISGWFNRSIIACLEFNRRLNLGLPGRMAIAGGLSGLIICLLPVEFHDSAGLRELLTTGDLGVKTLALAFLVKFAMTAIAAGSGASGGLFSPALILGAALGAFVGQWSLAWFDLGNPTTYALAGMGGFFGAVAKVPITAIAIIFEMTMDFNLVLPLMIVVVVSYVVAEQISSGSLYDRLLELSGLKLELDQREREHLGEIAAGAVMQRQVETLTDDQSLEAVRQTFARSKHRGFPVVKAGKLVGMVAQSDLVGQAHLHDEIPLARVMTQNPISVQASESLADVLYRLNHHKIGRLPVVEGRRLVGIITRSDIIQAEFQQLDLPQEINDRVDPSYLVYRTQAPSTGRGRMLVALSTPAQSSALVHLAASIARDCDYELECLHVVTVPQHTTPSEAQIDWEYYRHQIETAVTISQSYEVPTHAQIRIAHDIVPTILETLRYRSIDRLVMGWNTDDLSPSQLFGARTDRILRHVNCGVVLVKWGKELRQVMETNPKDRLCLNRWLVPVSGGRNAKLGLTLLSGLVRLGDQPAVRLCRVFDPECVDLRASELKQVARELAEQLGLPIAATPLVGRSIVKRMIELAHRHHYDVVLLGASEQTSLQQMLRGNIPYEIARGCDSTVILVRGEKEH